MALATSERSPVRHGYGVSLRQEPLPGTYISVSEPVVTMATNSKRSEATDSGMTPSFSLSSLSPDPRLGEEHILVVVVRPLPVLSCK
jgi:hypothetical protein